MLFKNPVTVRTSLDRRRISVVCGVAYGEDLGKAREIIRRALHACPSVDKTCAIEVMASEFGDSGINFLVRWWAAPRPSEEHHSRDEVVEAIKRALDEAGIEIPVPYRTLTFKEEPQLRAHAPVEHARH